MAKIILAQLGLDEKAFLQSAQRTKIAIDKLTLSQKKLEAQSKTNSKEYIKNQTTLKSLNSTLLQQKKNIIALESPYAKLSNRLIRARREFKDLAATTGISNKRLTEARTKVLALDRQLKKIDKSVGQSQRNVGNYGGALKGLATSFLGVTAVIFGTIRAISNIIKMFSAFEKENAILSGILQQTTEQTKSLRDNAEELGATTAKTATEVTGLQIAFARLGFSQTEILNLTEATIAGSIAMNAELSETANLVGAIIRSFDDLDSSDADMVIDVLTLATAKSALNFEKLSKALPIVAGAANAVDLPLTKVVATLGKLSDSGIDASTSATAFRNILIESAKRGIDYETALAEIAVSTNKLTTANVLFGKRAAVSALIIASNSEALKELDEALQNAQGTAEEMANKQLVTLIGKTILAKSAWQGFIFSIENGQGTFSKAIKSMIDGVTGLLTELTLINGVTEILSKKDLVSQGIFKFFGPVGAAIGAIKNTAKASAQLKLLNDDFKELKKEGVDDLIDAYGFYEDKLEDVGKTDENHTKLLEFQLIRIEELIKAKKQQVIIDEAATDVLFEQKQGIIDILLETDKKLKSIDLEKKSIEELNIILNNANNDETIRLEKQKANRKANKKQAEQDRENEKQQIIDFEREKMDITANILQEQAENDEERAVQKEESRLEKELFNLENSKLSDEQKYELSILRFEEHEAILAEIKAEWEEKKAKIKEIADEKEIQRQIKANEASIKADARLTKSEQNTARIRGAVARGLANLLGKLLGESLFAKIASIAIEAGLQVGLVKIQSAATSGKIAASLATANAGALAHPFAIASLGITAIPVIAANTAIATAAKIANVAGAAAAISGIITGAAVQSIGAVGRSFYEGGQVPNGTGGRISGSNIPTQRGGDNILATVKSGEVILNEEHQQRAGGSAFFNSIGVPGFADGGAINVPQSIITQSGGGINTEAFAEVLAERINLIQHVAIVEEIESGLDNKITIEQGANI